MQAILSEKNVHGLEIPSSLPPLLSQLAASFYSKKATYVG